MTNMGILSMLADNDFMARLEQKQRIAKRVAEQMGVSLEDARAALDQFEADRSSDGQTIN
ncbi:hypothetical protein ACVWZ4_006124 [Bradyrhizobium sp. USDA 4472]